VTSQAEEHTHWVIQSALASPEVLFAVLTVSAASLLDLEEGTTPSSTGLADAKDHGGTISERDAITLKIIATKLLRSAVKGDTPLEEEFLLYSVMCLMVAEVNVFIHMLDRTLLRCLKIVAGDTDAIRVHADALRGLIDLRAGFENLPGYLTEILLS
jgi:hypothetical protein